MSIWKQEFTLKELNQFSVDSMVDHLGITYTEFGDDYLVATMPVDPRTKQPRGIMHGGASAVLAESVGSMASNGALDQEKEFAVGLEISTTHLRMAKDGHVKGVAKPIHLGAKIHVWEVKIYDEKERLISLSRLTTSVLKKRDMR